jgi:nucleoside-diphosphate-sugar epimerase
VLVVGGTGPSGVSVVNGLIERGHLVTILHRGLHEVVFIADVEHIHADPHFKEPLEDALAGRQFDVTLCLYGRVRLVADVMRHRTDRFLSISGVFYDGWVDGQAFVRRDDGERWTVDYTHGHDPVTEDEPSEITGTFAARAVETEALVLGAHEQGGFAGTVLRFPQMYGPRQPAPLEWCLVRRARDGRRRVIVPDGGLALHTRLYSENAARGVLAAVDNADSTASEVFNIGDDAPISIREWITTVGSLLGHDFDMVSMRLEDATPSYPYALYPWRAGHRVLSVDKAKRVLGFDPLPTDLGMARTIEWYLEHPLDASGEDERKLGDAFDYVVEDEMVAEVSASSARIRMLTGSMRYEHSYDHPDRPIAPPT